jgi:NDP-sugar pyrophosphorylase family protein
MVSFHKKNKALVSILVRKANNASEYGEIHMDRHSRITGFNEKNKNASSRMINAGVYIFDKKVFKLMPSARKFSLEQDFFPRLINKNIYGYKSRGYFIDIGTPARYLCARRYFGKR